MISIGLFVDGAVWKNTYLSSGSVTRETEKYIVYELLIFKFSAG